MKRIVVITFVALVAWMLLPARGQDAKPANSAGAQRPETFEKQVTVTRKANYLLYLPKRYGEDPQKKWPVILFLHGSGERGADINLVKLHGPPKVIEQGRELPFVVVSPQCPEGKWWDPDVVVALLDEVVAKYNVDADRIYLTGLSMGGYGTWETAVNYPDRFAAIAPICGWGNRYRTPDIRHIPTWVFHGDKDQAVSVNESVEMVETLKRIGGNVRLTRYPDAGHDSWTATYEHRALYDWFLQHKRGQRPAGAAK